MEKYIVRTQYMKGKKVQTLEVYMHANNLDNLRKNLIMKGKKSKKNIKFNVWSVSGDIGYGDELGTLFFFPEYDEKPKWARGIRGVVTAYDVSSKTGKISNPRRV